jgi:hypothetical protein
MTEVVEPLAHLEVPTNLAERPSRHGRATGTPAPGRTQRVTVTTGSTRPRRRHPALGARILSTGMSTAAMFGIVAALGVQNPPPANAAQDPTPAVPAAIVVDPTAAAPMAVTVSELSDRPIQLTATPIVRAAQPAPTPAVAAPVARTNGSR